jgi:hypothetical protein
MTVYELNAQIPITEKAKTVMPGYRLCYVIHRNSLELLVPEKITM